MDKKLTKKSYLFLTGDTRSGNVGDKLITRRAIELFTKVKGNKRILKIDRRETIDPENLKNFKAILLTGGPALQHNMIPEIYPSLNIDEVIKNNIPVILFGIGHNDYRRDLCNTVSFNEETRMFLNFIKNQGFYHGVRDIVSYRTLKKIFDEKLLLTGCPAMYSEEVVEISKSSTYDIPLRHNGDYLLFSTPNRMFFNRFFMDYIKELLLHLREIDNIVVIFHHPTSELFLTIYGETENNITYLRNASRFKKFLNNHGLKWIDTENSLEKMILWYNNSKMHIGFRLHGHILSLSLLKPSILIVEDGRSFAVSKSFNFLALSPFKDKYTYFPEKLIRYLLWYQSNRKICNPSKLAEVIRDFIRHEKKAGYILTRSQILTIAKTYPLMEKLINEIP